MLFERLLGWFAGALRAPFFLNTLRLFYSKASGFIPKASGLVCWGPSGPFLFKDAPPFLFEGFWVYSKGSGFSNLISIHMSSPLLFGSQASVLSVASNTKRFVKLARAARH